MDGGFRASFRRDPVGACVAAGLPGLAAELGGAGGGMETLELRESRSSLAGVVMAVAAEGLSVVEAQALVGASRARGLHGVKLPRALQRGVSGAERRVTGGVHGVEHRVLGQVKGVERGLGVKGSPASASSAASGWFGWVGVGGGFGWLGWGFGCGGGFGWVAGVVGGGFGVGVWGRLVVVGCRRRCRRRVGVRVLRWRVVVRGRMWCRVRLVRLVVVGSGTAGGGSGGSVAGGAGSHVVSSGSAGGSGWVGVGWLLGGRRWWRVVRLFGGVGRGLRCRAPGRPVRWVGVRARRVVGWCQSAAGALEGGWGRGRGWGSGRVRWWWRCVVVGALWPGGGCRGC